MRPIKLRIKGLNSFIDEQTIDFNKLTERGLFGIFGPTGSGKSSILDGITLALYGNVARKSSNYINVNCDKANVNFEFQITTDVVNRYVIDREFKRKKDGAINAGKCKIIDEETGDILAEGVKSVNKKVEEILGLNLDDFTRTVVLPQGKFSDFLKLEGKDRREMLERLFNLQKYGDILSRKLASKIYEEKDNNNVLIGQLSGYEDVSSEKLNEKKDMLKELENTLKEVHESVVKAEKTFKENEEVWNLNKELNLYIEKDKELKLKEDNVKEFINKVRLGEAANRVIPYLDSLENTIKNLNHNNSELEKMVSLIKEVKVKREQIQKIFEDIKKEKDDKRPKLLIEEQRVNEAVEDEKILNNILDSIKELSVQLKKYEFKIASDEENLKKNNESVQVKTNEVREEQKEYDSLKIDENFKQKVQEALLVSEKLILINNNINNDNEKKKHLEEENEEVTQKGKHLKSIFDAKEKELLSLKESLDNMEKNPPCSQNDLLKIKESVVINKEKNARCEDLIKEKCEGEEAVEKLNSALAPMKNQEESLVKSLGELKVSKDKAVEKNFAIRLREGLNEGDECPVCGSVHHVKKHSKEEAVNIEEIENSIAECENTIKELRQQIIEKESNIKILNEKIAKNTDEINKIKNEMGSRTIEEMESELKKLTLDLENYDKNKEDLKNKINKLQVEINTDQGEINTLRAIIRTNRGQITILNKDIDANMKQQQDINSRFELLKKETGVLDFKKKNDEIKANEHKRDVIEVKLKNSREALEKLEKQREELKNDLSLSKEKLASIKSQLASYEKNRDEKSEAIRSKVGENKNLLELLNNIKSAISDIDNNYKRAEADNSAIENKFNEVNEKLISCETRKIQLEKMKDENEVNLKNIMEKEQFSDAEEVRASYVEDLKLAEYKEFIESYKDSVSRVHGTIEILNNKINGRECSEDKYTECKNILAEEKDKFNSLNESKIKLEAEVKDLSNKVVELKDILDKKSKLEHKMALLSDLEKLFKGKKFIEFVAANQLKYISIEASKRLKDITHGNYGLEVDNNGKFIIRDYKNGGISRDASTLSGGETFLASLALALALSAQIQLKGTAPLELFFLDEGFGTLDDNLLDVVMGSLETIHNDKLKVGIISHVESIKNRVPVKLIVTPAECGVGGSKVKIEVN